MCLFKYDNYKKEGFLVTREGIYEDAFVGFNSALIKKCCILSGCDYVKSLSGIGLKTAT